jgi:hypothetical protein
MSKSKRLAFGYFYAFFSALCPDLKRIHYMNGAIQFLPDWGRPLVSAIADLRTILMLTCEASHAANFLSTKP